MENGNLLLNHGIFKRSSAISLQHFAVYQFRWSSVSPLTRKRWWADGLLFNLLHLLMLQLLLNKRDDDDEEEEGDGDDHHFSDGNDNDGDDDNNI